MHRSSARISRPVCCSQHTRTRRHALRFEDLESRTMLSVSPIPASLPPSPSSLVSSTDIARVEAVLDYLSSDSSTAYLQQGNNHLRLLEIAQDEGIATTRFQQTYSGIPVHGAIVTVVQGQADEIYDVFDHGRQNLVESPSVGMTVRPDQAEQIAAASFGLEGLSSNADLVWFPTGRELTLAWQVNSAAEPLDDGQFGDFMTIVDARSGEVLSHEKLDFNYLDQFAADTGVFPRIVINNAIGPAGARAYADPFDAVVRLTLGCTGTLIAPNVVLTARHCGGGSGSQIRFGDNSNAPTYTAIVSSVNFPAGGGSLLDGGDVSIMTLTQNVPANIATPMRLIEEGSALQGQLAAMIGYGYNGVGSQGHGFTADGFRWGGENIIDVFGSPAGASGTNIFSTDFDNGTAAANTIGSSSPVPVTFEATTAPGDSGGPLLVQTTDGEWVIAGTLSGGTTSTSVYGDISWWTGVAPFRSQIEAAGGVFLGGGIGTVDLDKGTYLVQDTVTITVRDPNAVAPIEVTIVSDSGDAETVTLSSSGGITYSGTIQTSGGSVSIADGTLQVALADEIVVTYQDPDNGNGSPLTVTDTATIGNIVQFNSTNVPLAINDNQRIFSDIVITDAGTVADVDVQIDVTHTYDADLEVFLNGPNGMRIVLFQDVGGSGNNFSGTILDDEAGTSITSGAAPFAGSYRPTGSLATYDGMSVTGTWTLEIFDDAAQDQGTLNAWSLLIDVVADAVSGDFNGDGNYDCADIDPLMIEIAAGTNDAGFDLTGDGLVDSADRDAWLAEAGAANLGPGRSYLLGDANLNGTVDGEDFLVWNAHKFAASEGWCSGDFNGDGMTDGSDFLLWNANKFQSSDRAGTQLFVQTLTAIRSRITSRRVVAAEFASDIAQPVASPEFAFNQAPLPHLSRYRDVVFATYRGDADDVDASNQETLNSLDGRTVSGICQST